MPHQTAPPRPAAAPAPAGAHRASVALSLFGLLALIGALFAPGSATAAPPAPTPQAEAAIDWLAAQLAANGDTMPASFGPGTDWGLTMDAVLAFVAAGRGSDAQAETTTDVLSQPANVAAYTTWTAGADTVRDAGPTGKTVLTLLSMGRSTTVGGTDLEAVLRGLMETTGVQTGRFSDDVPDPTWNASNGFGQSLSMLALALTDDGVPTQAIDFLVAQQCPAGGFRLTYGSTASCTDDTQADTDTTGLSLQALLAVPRTAAVQAALEDGISWLLGIQGSDGSFGGTGPTASPNSNSSGVIAQFLRAAGATTAADRAADYVTTLQLTPANTAGTPAAGEDGAIAYNPTGFASALTDGITTQMGDQWRRATSQAVLALGLSPYGVQDVDPVTTTTTTSTTTSSTTTVPTSTTTAPTPTTAAPTTLAPPSSSPTTTLGPSGGNGSAVDSLGASRGGASTGRNGTGSGALARTGDDAAPLAGLGVVLLVAGAAVAAAGRGRRDERS